MSALLDLVRDARRVGAEIYPQPDGRVRLVLSRMVSSRVGCAVIMEFAHEFSAPADRNPEGEKPQALSAKHESAVTAKPAGAQGGDA